MQLQSNNVNLTDIVRGRILPLVGLLIVSGIIFVSDRITKNMVVSSMAYGESWAPIPGFERIFRFTYITNSGAAFGLFPDSGVIFILVAIIVTGAIVYYYPMVNNWWVRIALGLQLGGALGNLWDRVFNDGEVIDFADLGFWPIFNIADISIVIGVIILAIWLWQQDDDLALKSELSSPSDV